MPNLNRLPSEFPNLIFIIPIKSTIIDWKFLKIRVEFMNSNNNQSVSVSVIMENDNIRTQLAKWPFVGRFKLTLIDNKMIPQIHESDCCIMPQPINVSTNKRKYPSSFLLAEIPQEDRCTTDRKFTFTLQIQEIENQ